MINRNSLLITKCAVLSYSVMSNSVQSHGLYLINLLCPRGFSRQEYWSGLPCPPPGDLPNSGIVPWSPALQVNSLPSEPVGNWPRKEITLSKVDLLIHWIHLPPVSPFNKLHDFDISDITLLVCKIVYWVQGFNFYFLYRGHLYSLLVSICVIVVPIITFCCCLVAKSCPTLLSPWTIAHGIFQATIRDCVAISFFRVSPDSWIKPASLALAGIDRQILYGWATSKALSNFNCFNGGVWEDLWEAPE